MAIQTISFGRMPRAPTVPTPTSTEAETTEPIEAIEPIEISRAPAIITTVSPMASSPTTTMAWARLFIRFCQEKNLSPPCISNQPLTTVIRKTSAISAKMSERLSAPMNFSTRCRMLSRFSRFGAAFKVSFCSFVVVMLSSFMIGCSPWKVPLPRWGMPTGDRPWRARGRLPQWQSPRRVLR